MNRCLACLGDLAAGTDYHPRCVRRLFGSAKPPRIDVDLARLHTLALAMAGHTSLSGVQRKISVGLSADRMTLRLEAEGGRYILKPQSQTFPNLPENEHLTMLLAAKAGIETPAFGLVRLADGSLAFVARRFDRADDGRKRLQEDFCQLAERSPKDKYQGSAELCARLVRRHADEPGIEALKLFRLMVFVWWTGNGDMHLKNFSVLRSDEGLNRLSPAYDLLCTRLPIPDDHLALPIGGNTKDITREQWLGFAGACGIPERAVVRVFSTIAGTMPTAADLVMRSALPKEAKEIYVALLQERKERLSGFL